MNAHTLTILRKTHLEPVRQKLRKMCIIQEIIQKNPAPSKERSKAEKSLPLTQKYLVELEDFISNILQCETKGAPVADPNSPPREINATYEPNLDDGVMINAAALWPLFPQWKEPKIWWKEISEAQGSKKDYDWSQLAKRYWPSRVKEKCKKVDF